MKKQTKNVFMAVAAALAVWGIIIGVVVFIDRQDAPDRERNRAAEQAQKAKQGRAIEAAQFVLVAAKSRDMVGIWDFYDRGEFKGPFITIRPGWYQASEADQRAVVENATAFFAAGTNRLLDYHIYDSQTGRQIGDVRQGRLTLY